MLAAMKLGLVLIPAMPTLGPADIADRLERGQAKYLVAHGADAEKFAGLGEASSASRSARRRRAGALTTRFLAAQLFEPDGPTKADDPMLLYFTSGTTARAKLVVHTPCELPDRPSLDHVRARPQARRRASQHFLARLGEARVVERVRALERRRDRDRAC